MPAWLDSGEGHLLGLQTAGLLLLSVVKVFPDACRWMEGGGEER